MGSFTLNAAQRAALQAKRAALLVLAERYGNAGATAEKHLREAARITCALREARHG